MSSLCDQNELQLVIYLMQWLLIASLSIKGRLSSIMNRSQDKMKNISYKKTNIPAYIINSLIPYSSWCALTFLQLALLIKHLRLIIREFNYIKNALKSPAYGFQGFWSTRECWWQFQGQMRALPCTYISFHQGFMQSTTLCQGLTSPNFYQPTLCQISLFQVCVSICYYPSHTSIW